jgi:hypothetical protein
MASDDENTTTWVQTPEEKARIPLALKDYLADEEHGLTLLELCHTICILSATSSKRVLKPNSK